MSKKYACEMCGNVHDEEKLGLWEEVPEPYICPGSCGYAKTKYFLLEE